jgi:hypothetical protein
VGESAAELVDRCYWRAAARLRDRDADAVLVGFRTLLAEVVAELDARNARRAVVAFEAGWYPQSDN